MAYSLERQSDLVAHILGSAQLDTPIEPSTVGVLHDEHGSLDMLGRQINNRFAGVEVMGFFTPSSLGVEGLPQHVDNINTLRELRARDSSEAETHGLTGIHRVGKGVGARLFNSLEAAAGWHDYERPVGLYGVRLLNTYDLRQPADHTLRGRLGRIAEHGSRTIMSRFIGVDKVVAGVHAAYGDAQAVAMTLPPRAELRALRHREAIPPMPPTMLILRDRSRMYRLGKVVRPEAGKLTSKD